ncbi:N-6 DNA methylase [Streptomyces otsuchiensis]|uniref:N-6 DNA methylase n=1 Tax=Streptomyces otsuchiensis TaxID=2681388 RepID=UPI001D131774|nr:N-6 DNA methylase [Streptomyces otsuchiensis]
MSATDTQTAGGDRAEVTAAGIARLAGVGRAAVSNWRRRHEDFPQPVGGAGSSPAFALTEVEEWLRAHGKLARVSAEERAWQLLQAEPGGAAPALAAVGDHLLGDSSPARPAAASATLSEAVALLAADHGPAAAYEALLERHLETLNIAYTPPETAALMAELAGAADSVLDPACGAGTLVAAARGRAGDGVPGELRGQEKDRSLARLAGLRLALRGAGTVRVDAGDSLLDDAHVDATVEVVLCHPPANERHWGHDELAYDARWEYGLPARGESELAWVQHALARLRPGGTAVLLLPPAVASRRAGRRVRSALLRRGALRAVIALPAGVAPPHGLPLHLWVLGRPDAEAAPTSTVLLVDTATDFAAEERGGLSWPELHTAVTDAWAAHRGSREFEEIPGLRRVLPAIDLLDDETDLTPARHLRPRVAGGPALTRIERELRDTLNRSTSLLPPVADGAAQRPARRADHGPSVSVPVAEEPQWASVTIGELVRGGAVEVHTALTSGAQLPTARPGDVFVPLLSAPDGAAAQVVTVEGARPPVDGRLALLRPDPEALDSWFLAGFVRGSSNTRQASSYASRATRIDIRRLKVPRIPLADQRRYGERFRDLATFEAALEHAVELGRQFVQGTVDGLADGTLPPG